MEEEGLDELISQIEETIGGFKEGINVDLANYVAELKQHMISGDFKNRSGDLRRSMSASIIDEYAIQISMIYYGYYLAFGVDIRKQTGKRTFGVSPEVADALNATGIGTKINNNGDWKFGQASKSNRVFGINARGTSSPSPNSNSNSFYPDNVLDRLEEIIKNKNKIGNA